MQLTERNHKDIINTFPESRSQPLLCLIPELESILNRDVHSHRRTELSQEVFRLQIKFQNAIEEIPIVISFDCPAWEEGRRMVSNPRFDFNSVDIPAKCKLLIALNRSDHFSQGAMAGNIESGLLLKIITSIRDQVERKNN